MHAHPSHQRRSCAGCLLHHPLTVGLTVVALILWLGQLVHAGIALAAGQPPDLLAVILATLLLVLAQLGPRLAPRLWQRWMQRPAPPLEIPAPSNVSLARNRPPAKAAETPAQARDTRALHSAGGADHSGNTRVR
jgi:hypothetical protein